MHLTRVAQQRGQLEFGCLECSLPIQDADAPSKLSRILVMRCTAPRKNAQCRQGFDIRLFRLGRRGFDPRVEHRNAGLFEVTGITRDDS